MKTTKRYEKTRAIALVFVLIHVVVSTIHGRAHQGAMVSLTTFGNLYVAVVITLAPLVAVALLFTRQKRMGALLFAFSMLGSLLFGFWYHFLSETSDNVAHVGGAWHSVFLWTAIALAVIELAATLVGFRLFQTAFESRTNA